MRFLNTCVAALMALCPISAAAQEVHLLVDVSSSTKKGASYQARSALQELGDRFVTVVPWNDRPLDPVYGSGEKVTANLPAPSGNTYLGNALSDYTEATHVCVSLVVLVHGESSAMGMVKERVAQLTSTMQVTILVIGNVADYETLVDSPNYQALELQTGLLPQIADGAEGQSCNVGL